MSIKTMQYVTCEQVLRLRQEAIKIEQQRNRVSKVLQEMINHFETRDWDEPEIVLEARDILKEIGSKE